MLPPVLLRSTVLLRVGDAGAGGGEDPESGHPTFHFQNQALAATITSDALTRSSMCQPSEFQLMFGEGGLPTEGLDAVPGHLLSVPAHHEQKFQHQVPVRGGDEEISRGADDPAVGRCLCTGQHHWLLSDGIPGWIQNLDGGLVC